LRGDSRLVAASPAERAQMARIAAAFSEEDLTRYLQLSLDLFPRSAVFDAAAVSSGDRAC
jgi:hypothetical protein